MIRVLQVTPYSLETNPYLRLLMEGLEGEGVDVRVATGRSPFLLARAVARDGFPDVVHLQWHHRYFTSTTLLRAVLRTTVFFLQWLALRLLGVRFVWTVHNILDHERRQDRWELFVCRRWARAVDALIVHCAEAVHPVAEAYRISPERVRVVPHGHFPQEGPGQTRTEARRQLGVPDDARVFLFFGRIRPYKGLETLLSTFAALEADDARLILVGFPDSEELGRSVAERVAADPRMTAHLEFVSSEALDGYLAAADVVVLPYRDLLTSGAAILAASRARPVLAPDLCCLRSLPTEAALLYPADGPDALADALRRAVVAPLDAMGATAKRHIDRFTWRYVAAETLAVYRRVFTSRPSDLAQPPG